MTNGITGLLHENLGEADHLRVIIKLFGEVDHGVSCVLLIAVPACSQKARESLLRDWIALLCTSCVDLIRNLVGVDEYSVRELWGLRKLAPIVR